ncbi:hypothetical protein KIH74_22960 [Kineosporia sp. J2-2]|uniref:Phage Mu protein F like protein n=1 Tax=Kineosporia corallincola TaxID=2835133 RepID=A0ABS5TLD3_9ACTN|nr:hypothetical protein [Kineosporia corallincola]MBT0771820.1 hypothetical protein [Kineosporia corallincola]
MPRPDPALVAESLALVQAQAAARWEIAAITQASVRAEVAAFAGWYSSADISSWVARLAKMTRASQRQTASSTSAFGLRLLRLVSGRQASRGRVDVDRLWGGVPLESVYARLADDYRFLRATEPLSDDQVLERVVQRAGAQTDQALTLAMRAQWQADAERSPVVSLYRRVIHPEVATEASARDGEAPPLPCGLCVVVADRVYKVAELLPVHTFCRCTVAPIVGAAGGSGDPGLSLNQADLERIYALGGGTSAAVLAKVRVAVREHGELGPVLRSAADEFRGPDQVKAAATR